MLPLLTWLIQGALGPAVVGLPATWAATDLARAAKQWFRRLRRSDGLSRIVRAAAGGMDLSDAEFAAIRELLAKESTWVEVGRGTVEDLAALIALRLPGRPSDGSLAAGRAIAGGLLEFAIRDLEPEWFRQVLFARLERMQADQASALDQAILSVHADLAALLAHRDAADGGHFADVVGQLARVLDRLPPGPADRSEVAVYLARLIEWLNTDPWPQDMRFAGPALAPAAVERKLRIASGRGWRGQNIDADDLARRCTRLVVLGGPGSGKTWLARRAARLCAEAALDSLTEGAGPEQLELPLYTTCARLAAAPPGEGIRHAVVASALGQLPDLGGSRVYDGLRMLFEERDAPTLLVVDSLDEARGADDRIRQADTLPKAWRIMLTSREASWNHQLALGEHDPSRQVGVLQPLRYPDDIEPVIATWFRQRPAWAASLAAQLRDRPALQKAVTVPLILAFYCVVGGDRPLPGRRADLYAKVIRRMLTGRWRGSGDCDPDPEACLEILRDWAWSAAVSSPVSGIGEWADEFFTPRIRQSQDDRDALDHVAVPQGPPDADTGMTMRRFVHRSLREHLVAEHIALRMPADQAAGELLNHLWYDPDWEYAGPAALAMHPQRDQVLKDLVCHLTGGDLRRADLAAIDSCWEIRRFLVQVAQESSEDAWQPDAAEMIRQARVDLAATMPREGFLRRAVIADWPISNRMIIQSLLGQLAGETDVLAALDLVEAVAGLNPDAQDRAQARRALLTLLAGDVYSFARRVAEAVVQVAVTAEERVQARQALLRLLAVETDISAALALADAVAGLNPGAEDLAQARQALLTLLTKWARNFRPGSFSLECRVGTQRSDPGPALWLAKAVAGLDPDVQDRTQARQALATLFARGRSEWLAWSVANAVAQLAVTAEERAQARRTLLALLGRTATHQMARNLPDAVAALAVTGEERAELRRVLLAKLADETDILAASSLAAAVARLRPGVKERAQARQALLTRAIKASPRKPSMLPDHVLPDAVVALAVTMEERAQARQDLLTQLARETDPWVASPLADAVAKLDSDVEERAQATQTLLTLLASQTNNRVLLKDAVTRLAVTAEERTRAGQALLTLLASKTDPWAASPLADAVTELNPDVGDGDQARLALFALLTLLAGKTDGDFPSSSLARAAAALAVTAEDRAQARQALLTLLASETDTSAVPKLADAVAGLAVTAEEREHISQALLTMLADETRPFVAMTLATTVAGLDPDVEDLTRARQALLMLLPSEADTSAAMDWALAVAALNPTVADLRASETWPVPPPRALLAAVRRNSGLPAWLAALPLLSTRTTAKSNAVSTTPHNR